MVQGTEKLKIAVVIPRYGLVGGAEGFASQLCESLAEDGRFEIHVIANKWKETTSPIAFRKVPIVPFPRFFRPLSFALFVQKRLREEDYDVVHSHERIFQTDLLTIHGFPHMTWVKEARRKRPSLFDISTAWIEKKGIEGGETRPILLPVSTLVKEEYLKLYNIPESNIHVVHPGVSLDRFKGLERAWCRQDICQKHRLSEDSILVLFVGMNFEIKGLDLVLKAAAELKGREERSKALKVLVVGKGNIRKYKAMANSLGMEDHVIFAGVTSQVEKYYMGSDIFILPSRYDAFPLVTLEAMAAGLPVIISEHVGSKDVIENGTNGFVVGPDPSVQELSRFLSHLLDRDLRMQMGQKAAMRACNFTWERTAEVMADFYFKFQRAGTTKGHLG